ncbi:ankyrin repeat domain-containing protein [Paenibacillus durus]|uniref:ankyrin repeat domain-containing protein n=1 Tax=Paenibacillus durus TaxID=44251 RepID=UPI00046F794F|nr:ankyrin repeat domain-containing protein [Paenibacillus durus]
MVDYKDLTCYSLQHFENAKNVGWINKKEDFHKGSVTKEFIEKLWGYIKYPLNTVRDANESKVMLFNGEKVTLGFSEIRVMSEDGKNRFAAPDLIFQYVMEYNYCPPKEFINAVLSGPGPYSLEYKNYMSKYNEQNLWGEDADIVELSEKLRRSIINNNDFIKKTIETDSKCINVLTKEGSLLNVSILNKNIDLAKQLIWMDIDINKFSGVELINAVLNDENELVELLLLKNIMFNLSSPKTNPLFIAVRKGNFEAVKLLLNKGVDPSIEYSNEFMKNFNVIQLAQKMNQSEIVTLLNEHEPNRYQ